MFLNHPVARALLSGYVCNECSTPVSPSWTSCPVCGSTKMQKSGTYEGLEPLLAKHKKPKTLTRKKANCRSTPSHNASVAR